MEPISHLLYHVDQHRQPLRELVHNYEALRKDPAGYLANRKVVIGPAAMFGMATMLGCLFTILLMISFALCARPLWSAACWLAGVDEATRLPGDSFFWVLGGSLLLGFVGAFRFMHGHQIVLRKEGVEFHRRRSHVFCPWTLFQAAYNVVSVDIESIRVPINLTAIPEVVLYRGERRLATGLAVRKGYFRINGCTLDEAGHIQPRDEGSELVTVEHIRRGFKMTHPRIVVPNAFQAPGMEIALRLIELGAKMGRRAGS